MIELKDTFAEKYGLFKQRKKGKCSNSPFANGHHRVTYVPKDCPLDNGIKGFSAHMECIDCGKNFNKSVFVI